MKTKIMLFALVALFACVTSQAQKYKLYVNPVKSQVNFSTNNSRRLTTSIMTGLSKAKHVVVVRGETQKSNEALKAEGYMMVLNPVVVSASVAQDEELLSSKKKDTYTAKIEVAFQEVSLITDANATVNYSGSGNDKDPQMAYYKAAESFIESALDLADETLVIGGDILDVEKQNDDKEAKLVRVGIGGSEGIRSDMMFDVYKVNQTGDAMYLKALKGEGTKIGKARCEQVLSATEALLKVYGSKDGDVAVFDALQNMDGTYSIVVVSRAKSSWGKMGKGITDALSAKKERGSYYEPDLSRTSKLKVGLLGCEAGNSNVSSSDVKVLLNKAVEGLEKVTTISFDPTIYGTIEAAKKAGLDGVIDISFDNKEEGTEKTKDGKTRYTLNVAISVAGINAQTGEWIEMRPYEQPWSDDKKDEMLTKAIDGLSDDVKKFAEDVFPVAGLVVDANEIKKDKVKSANINIGSNVGVRKNMMFDIYVQYKDGGADSRFQLGTGKVKGDPAADSAVINVKGKQDGDKRMYELLQNKDENLEIVVISRAHIDRVDQFLGGFGKLLK